MVCERSVIILIYMALHFEDYLGLLVGPVVYRMKNGRNQIRTFFFQAGNLLFQGGLYWYVVMEYCCFNSFLGV